MSKGFLGVIAAIILLFVGIAVFNGGNKAGAPSSKSSGLSQHIKGSGTDGVTLVEYGDFQCPACESYEPIVSSVVSEYGDRIKFQFRNFPLTNLHKNAFAGARAAEAASMQGKFWEMHDLLYQQSNWQVWTQASNPNTYFDQYAQQLGLNAAKFKSDFASDAVNETVNADLAEGTKLKLTGTPSFFINGKKTEIQNDIKEFEKALNSAIDSQKSQ